MEYTNISIELPNRIKILDTEFSRIAKNRNYEATYLLMKLYPSFLAPYERITNKSHASKMDNINRVELTKLLHLNDVFNNSVFVADSKWHETSAETADDFCRKVVEWFASKNETTLYVKDVLSIVRNALAHSNIHFGGKTKKRIDHVFFASNWPKKGDKIKILMCSIEAAEYFTDFWIQSIKSVGLSSGVIWQEILQAAAA